jgi:hypothetical protein
VINEFVAVFVLPFKDSALSNALPLLFAVVCQYQAMKGLYISRNASFVPDYDKIPDIFQLTSISN